MLPDDERRHQRHKHALRGAAQPRVPKDREPHRDAKERGGRAAAERYVVRHGEDGREKITMEELGELSGRFNYEMACDLGKRIPRVYTKMGNVVASKDYHSDF